MASKDTNYQPQPAKCTFSKLILQLHIVLAKVAASVEINAT
jgi:hypothetical protein